MQAVIRFCRLCGSGMRKLWLPLFVGLVCALLLVEGFLALLVSKPEVTRSLPPVLLSIAQTVYQFSRPVSVYLYGRHDAKLGYRYNEGSFDYSTSEFETTLAFNSQGLRSSEEALQAPQIIFLGDSVTMGTGVEGNETFAYLVTKEFGWCGLNAGVGSYGTPREMELLRQLDTSALRWIVLQHHGNDAPENQAFYRANGNLSVMSEETFEKLHEEEQSKKNFGLLKHLRAFIYGHLEARRRELGREVAPQEKTSAFLFALEGATSHLPEGVRLLLIDTDGYGVYSPVFGNLVAEKARSGNYPPWIKSLTFVNLSEVMGPEDGFVLDSHPNARGHANIAREIVKAIRASEPKESAGRDAKSP